MRIVFGVVNYIGWQFYTSGGVPWLAGLLKAMVRYINWFGVIMRCGKEGGGMGEGEGIGERGREWGRGWMRERQGIWAG